MKKQWMWLALLAALLALTFPAQAGWNPLDVAADGKGIAVYTSSSGGKQAGILYNGYSDSLSLEETNGLNSCGLTPDYEVWLNQSKAEKNQPKVTEGMHWYGKEWAALMPSDIFVAEVVLQDAPFYTTPGHKRLSAKHAAGTLVKVCGEFGDDYLVQYGGYEQTGFMPKSALRKLRDITYTQANYGDEHWGLDTVYARTVYTGGTPLAVGGSATGYSDMGPMVLKDGQTVTVLKYLDGWTQLAEGYFVESRFLDRSGDHSVTYATVQTDGVLNRLNVRYTASTESWVACKLCSGVQVQVPAHTDQWASVFITGPKGGENWSGSAQMRYLVFGEKAEKVKSGCVRVRTTETLYDDYSGKAILPAGEEMTVIGVFDGFDVSQDDADAFLFLLDDGMITAIWGAGGSLEPLETLGVTAKAASSVRLREEPGKEAKVLRTLDRGTRVEVLLRGEGWTMVKYKDQTGYIMSRYLQFP